MLARYLLSACVGLFVCPSVRLSQAGTVSKRLDASSWFSAWRFPSTYPTLCCKEIWVSSKIRVLPSGTLSQTPDSENFTTALRHRCSCRSTEQTDGRTLGRFMTLAVYYVNRVITRYWKGNRVATSFR